MACSGLQGLCLPDCEGSKEPGWKHCFLSHEEQKGRLQGEGEVQPGIKVAKEGSPPGCLYPAYGPGWWRGAASKTEAEGPDLRQPELPAGGDLSQL